MAQPFHYSKYVTSQIADESEFNNQNRNNNFSNLLRRDNSNNKGNFRSEEPHSKVSIKSKFNELVDLCRNENTDINSQFRNVVGAQRSILEMLQSQFEKNHPQTHYPNATSQYVRSNVRNFPTTLDYPPRVPPLQNSEKTAFLKEKMMDLAEENKQLKYYVSTVERPEDDSEILQLQMEINRLRLLLPKYENEIGKLKRPKRNNKFLELMEQGERIRQDTISMLKSQSQSTFWLYEDYFSEENELQSLRRKCKELEEENAQLKRISKNTQFTGISQNYS